MQINRYEKGKIYKIVDNGYNECYFGSTIQPLYKRLEHHRSIYKSNGCASALILNKYGVETCKIELVENYPCDNREELRAREGYYIQNHDCVNKYIPGGVKADWDKRYYERTKKTRKENMKIYYDEHHDEIKTKGKEYRETHKEEIKERDKKYKETHKEMLNAKKVEPILCECGCYSVRSSIARHRTSKKHLQLMTQKQNEVLN